MEKISSIHAIEILDSRGTPTVEVILKTNNFTSRAKVPSGASTGEKEALELRDKDPKRYFSKGVLKAINNVNTTLNDLLKNEVLDQEKLDLKMIEKDGTPFKENLGANAILGVSMAIAKTIAKEKKVPLYKHFDEKSKFLPCPMMNIINGGAHANNSLDCQEFMIRPIKAPTFKEAIRCGSEIFHVLKTILKQKNHSTSVGDEGGFAPNLNSDEEALELIMEAIKKAGYQNKVTIALDMAASFFYDQQKKLYIEKKKSLKNLEYKTKTSEEQVKYIESLVKNFPIDSIEDGLDENDYLGWSLLTKNLKNKIQIVGDDIFVTNKKLLQMGIDKNIANAILIKPNQIGTITETLKTIDLAKKNNYKTIISHRSGETEDSFIADFAVGVSAKQIKTGSMSRSDRISKYNRLLEIEDELKSPIYF